MASFLFHLENGLAVLQLLKEKISNELANFLRLKKKTKKLLVVSMKNILEVQLLSVIFIYLFICLFL